MPQPGLIFRALVASPSDCIHERRLIPEVIAGWNAVHSLSTASIVEPVLWETHAFPGVGSHPQVFINDQLVKSCDLVIGAFWTRLGTPTVVAESGTAEEIEQFRSSGKPALLYFSSAPVVPESLDHDQYKALVSYRNRLAQNGLYFKYESLAELRDLLHRHLAAQMIKLLEMSGSAMERVSPTANEVPAQDEALKKYLADFRTFLRRTSSEWSSERDSEPYNIDDGKYILARTADELLNFNSMIENDSLGVADKLGAILKRLKAIQRHRLYMDGGKSFAEFWAEGDAILADLALVAELLAQSLGQR